MSDKTQETAFILDRAASRQRKRRIELEAQASIARYRLPRPERHYKKSRAEDIDDAYARGFNAGVMRVVADLIARGVIDSSDCMAEGAGA